MRRLEENHLASVVSVYIVPVFLYNYVLGMSRKGKVKLMFIQKNKETKHLIGVEQQQPKMTLLEFVEGLLT